MGPVVIKTCLRKGTYFCSVGKIYLTQAVEHRTELCQWAPFISWHGNEFRDLVHMLMEMLKTWAYGRHITQKLNGLFVKKVSNSTDLQTVSTVSS